MDQPKDKGLPEYQHLMQRCFEEYHRVLKPGRWMTVVFHNSKNAVWNAIQEAMLAAGFVVADVRTLDKQQGLPAGHKHGCQTRPHHFRLPTVART